MSESEIIALCQRNENKAQKELFSLYYGRMMGLCLRYAKNKAEAEEMLESGFLKVFSQIHHFNAQSQFEDWIKFVFIENNASFLKSNRQQYYITTTVTSSQDLAETERVSNQVEKDLNKLNTDNYIKAIQQLPPSFRNVYNMFVIDEYSHKKIAECLEISEETSKRNLEQARFTLLKNIQTQNS